MNKGKTIGIIALVLVAVMALTLGIINSFKSPKLAYVNNTKLFNDFAYKKELEKELAKVESAKKDVLDSLRMQLELKASMLEQKKSSDQEVNEFRIYEQQYVLKQKQYTQDHDILAKQYTDQVWKQLNQYVQEYGENNSYSMIFGTTSSGEIMYGQESEDVTEVVLQFANKRFQGAKK